MREKMLKIADCLIERADAYEEPFGDDRAALLGSPSFAISSTLKEVAFQIRKVLEGDDDGDKTVTFDEWWNKEGHRIDPDFSDVPWFDKREGLAAAAFDAATEGLRPKHKCRKIATAIMGEGRDWWVGELLEPVPGHEIETHCLHMLTPLKDIVFLVNDADFQWLTVLGQAACGPINQEWLNSVTSGAMKRASDEDRQ